MPLFVSDEEFSQLRNDPVQVADKADAFIRNLYNELETVRAQADASSMTAEQTCSLLEQKYLSLSTDFSELQSRNAQLQSSLDERISELAQVRADKHQLHLQSIEKDGENERLKAEVSELHKSKRQLIELVEQKDLEISEKNATIKSYLDKIVELSDNAAQREARLSEISAELSRTQAACARLSQEKELIERHNAWLNDELTAKVDNFMELRRTHADLEADLSSKLADVERQFNECSSSLQWNKDRVRELEMKITSLQEELLSTKDAAVGNEEQVSAELSTVNKLAELYKESSEEWSKKAGELEGVIKALETHLNQVENDYKKRLEKEVNERKQFEQDAADLKVKLEKCEAEIESIRKANELNLLSLNNFTTNLLDSSFETHERSQDDRLVVPKIPIGVSGTALAASLLRDGWSLAKIYAKYQEAIDALRHEQLGRKESEAVLQRVLYELEEKAELILDERAEHERMLEAYSKMSQKLQNSSSEQTKLEKTIQELKADIRRHERDYSLAQKEIIDLQKQVTVLLKECRDIQIRCGSAGHDVDSPIVASFEMSGVSDAEKVISERLLTFKDINGLVEQNIQLRSLVRNLSDQIENKELEFKEKLELELKNHTDEVASRVASVLQRSEEQGCMIEALHASVGMYKRLYEEEHKLHLTYPSSVEATPEDGTVNLKMLLEGTQEATRKAQEQAAERLKCLEEELAKSRNETVSARSERDKLALEANFARDRLESFMKEFEYQRKEMNGVLGRNAEFSQLLVDYQRKLRESYEPLQAAEERSRKLNMEVSVLKHEKEMLINAEKRACDEVRSLSERVHRLQVSLDTIQSAEQVREESRVAERRKQEEYIKRVEREWAEAKKELQEERDIARTLTLDREQSIKNAMRQVEEMGKDLSKALHDVAAAETRAAVAEAKLSELENRMKSSDFKGHGVNGEGTPPFSSNEDAKERIERLREEAEANKNHMLQYKHIAEVNEDALKRMECAHENFKIEAEKLRETLEAELLSLGERVSELENESSLKSEEVASAAAGKQEALSSSLAEITNLREENSAKTSELAAVEIQLSAVKEDLENEHQRWCATQANYERQVILQSETIQELNKTSRALASLQEEASELRRAAATYKAENDELKTKWEKEKSILEESKAHAEKKYKELDEQNKLLHSRLEALHIQLAERDRMSSGISIGTNGLDSSGDSGLQNVISYLRRSKEIAETEISLLKQEKLRLQSQLDSAFKAAEIAQSSLHAERANARSLLFTEEEIKSLQLQVREINLLRESNMQLREENKHNLEECQKLREIAQKTNADTSNLERLLKERQVEVEACKKEIEMQRLDKEQLERRVSELIERCRNIDMEECGRLKDDILQMQEKLKDKDAQLEEMKKLLSEKEEKISQLERDLSNCKVELTDREKRIKDSLQAEANLKSELERYRRISFNAKKRNDKEKEELTKENQSLAKQLEEVKKVKRPVGDTSGEQAMKEERDTRIQILEKTIERHREELKREKEENRMEKARRIKNEKAVKDSYNNVEQEKTKLVNELKKHKQAVRRLSDELEKLKLAKDSLPEGTSVAQYLAGTLLDDHIAAYVLAFENFEKAAQSVFTEVSSHGVPVEAPPVVETTLAAAAGAPAPAQALNVVSSVSPMTGLPPKVAEESEKKPKTNEVRKIARKLVRPHLGKPEESQGDTEMTEMEAPSAGGKTALSIDSEAQGITSLAAPLVRKRQALSSTPGSHEESVSHGESALDVAVPLPKKSKGSNSPLKGNEEQSGIILENLERIPATEESADVSDLPQGSNEEVPVDNEKEVETTGVKDDEQKEEQFDAMDQAEPENDGNNVLEENMNKAGVKDAVSDDGALDHSESENQQPIMGTGDEREEGEFGPDALELEGGGDTTGTTELVEVQDERATPVASPARVTDEAFNSVATDIGLDVISDDKNDETNPTEETAEGSDKSNDSNEQHIATDDQAVDAALAPTESTSTVSNAENAVSKPESPSVALEAEEVKQVSSVEAEEVKHVSPVSSTSTTINLQERARQRGLERRQAAGVPSNRGRGAGYPDLRSNRAARGRGQRGRMARGGRGQPSGDQS